MRSRTLLASSILASLYNIVLMWAIIGLMAVDAGGNSIISAVGGFFEASFKFINIELAIINYLYILGILFLVHIGLFVVGNIISWTAYALKSASVATVASIVYLIGTICSPICIILGIPVTALTFIGAFNQKKYKKTEKE